jgi:mannose-6-phosphate isomerase-like protein (cupin superfamily)
MKATNRQTAPHYTWGAGCDGWRLVDAPDLCVIEELMPGGTAETTHFHRSANQVFIVLSGALSIALENETIALKSGDALNVPPMTVHKVQNRSETETRFLVISAPSTAGDRVDVQDD